MNFLKDLWKKIPNNTRIYGIIIFVIVIAFIFYNWKTQSLEAKLKMAQSNVSALKDTVRIVKTKNGELESVRLVLLADKNSLKQLSDSLDREVKKEKGKVKVIIKAPVSIVSIDTVTIISHVTDSSIYWNYDREDSGGSRHLAGVSTKEITKITRDEIYLNLIAGVKEREDKKLEIFIRTKYPGVTFGDIQGAIIDPTQPVVKPPSRYFGIGPCIAVLIDPMGKIRYGVGVSLQWSVIKF